MTARRCVLVVLVGLAIVSPLPAGGESEESSRPAATAPEGSEAIKNYLTEQSKLPLPEELDALFGLLRDEMVGCDLDEWLLSADGSCGPFWLSAWSPLQPA